MQKTQKQHPSTSKKLLWFVGLWFASVLVLALVGGALKLVLTP
ncbi:DUF2474 family protein [Kordiimonas pumila]|uniref:DUF2474 family protein n=1 Tax=Kordiimonas pumila TaxID=2161677 RepID=A0ABV7D7C5_9PROT|nr:DUF2474 family protein [Kordiimonas pumila]